MFDPLSDPVFATSGDFPACDHCDHEWHGLACRVSVVITGQGGRRVEPCGCTPAHAAA